MTRSVEALYESRDTFLTFGGVETHLLFQQDYPLRDFCAFEVLEDDEVWSVLEAEFLLPTLAAAAEHGHGILTDALVWRASPDYVQRLGRPPADVRRLNALAVWRMRNLATRSPAPVIVAAEVGPRGDGYLASKVTSAEARNYHSHQVEALAEAAVDMVVALTMTAPDEAVGIAEAARDFGLPVAVSATVETDGRMPDGTSLRDFVGRVDDETDGLPLFYMLNCAHPTHVEPTFESAYERGEPWIERVEGFRANASPKSHAELDGSNSLDRGDPLDLAERVAVLADRYGLRVLGGCCGTDAEHIAAIGAAVRRLPEVSDAARRRHWWHGAC